MVECGADLERLELRYDRSVSGPQQLEVLLAVDGGLFQTIFRDDDVSSLSEEHLAIDLQGFDGVQSATFRLHAFAAASASGTFDLEDYQSGRAVAVHGATAVPEPRSLLLSMMVLVSGVIRFRRSGISARRIDGQACLS
jgi:hypothetical protein